jgi:hypothetical protein
MKPGPELDALVAEYIMGWKKIPIDICGLDWMWDKREGCFLNEVRTVPNYSTDLNKAWELVGRAAGALTLTENLRQPGSDKLAWEAWFDPFEEDWAVGESPAHAICLAALKIHGVIKTDFYELYTKIGDSYE